jgi:putative transposase
MLIDFRGCHHPAAVILFAVIFYVGYGVFYRDLEELMSERGVDVDHATLNRWVVRYGPVIASAARMRKRPTGTSWRMDETYVKVICEGQR